MKILNNQKLNIVNKMDENFKNQKSIIVEGINDNNQKENFIVKDYNLYIGTALDENKNELILDKNVNYEISSIFFSELISEKPKEIDNIEIISANTKDQNILYMDLENNNIASAKYRKNDHIDQSIKVLIENNNINSIDNDKYINFNGLNSTTIRSFEGYKISKDDDNNLYLDTADGKPIGQIIKFETDKSENSGFMLIKQSDVKSLINCPNLDYYFEEASSELSDWEPGMVMSDKDIIIENMKEYTKKYDLLCPEVTSFIKINNSIEEFKIEDNVIKGIVDSKEIEIENYSMKMVDNEIFIKSGRKNYQISSVDEEFLIINDIDNKHDLFTSINDLSSKFDKPLVDDYEILKEVKFNKDSKSFEEQYIFKTEDIEINLNQKSLLSLQNGFLQHENNIYFLANSEKYNIKTEHLQDKAYLEQNKVFLNDKPVRPDIVLEEYNVMFKKGKIYSLEVLDYNIVGLDSKKPTEDNYSYVAKRINDLDTDKMKDLKLDSYKSNKINDWNIERIGPVLMFSGNQNGNRVYAQLKEINPEGFVTLSKEDKTKTFELGSPNSELNSIYKMTMTEVLNNNDFNTLCLDCNTKIYNYKDLVENSQNTRVLPRECFVSIDDNLYMKLGDKLIGSTELLDYKESRFDIDYAFTTTPNDSKIIKEVMGENFEIIKDKETIRVISNEMDFEFNPTSIYEGDRYANLESELDRDTDFPEMEM